MSASATAVSFANGFEAKVVIALVGALVGWGLKVAWDHWQITQRWKRLSPYIVKQVEVSAKACAKATDTLALSRVGTKLDASQKSAVELVAAGIEPDKWVSALELIVNCLDSIQSVHACAGQDQVAALEELRAAGQELLTWISTDSAR